MYVYVISSSYQLLDVTCELLCELGLELGPGTFDIRFCVIHSFYHVSCTLRVSHRMAEKAEPAVRESEREKHHKPQQIVIARSYHPISPTQTNHLASFLGYWGFRA